MTPDELLRLAREIEQQPPGSMIISGNWGEDAGAVGGCECMNCAGIFMGAEWRNRCKRCDIYKKAVFAAFTRKPS